ncbi:MAG: hypothetical protein WB558_19315 [Terriglobales bacterium]
MAAELYSANVHQIVPFGQEVPDECSFSERQTFTKLLPRPGHQSTGEDYALTEFCVQEVLHQPRIVELRADPAPNPISLANVKRLKLLPKDAAKNVHARDSAELVQINGVHHV